ncbi:MAG TPA: tyrosine-type recombinase/integrase, partial [Gaiellaceae bacterium]
DSPAGDTQFVSQYERVRRRKDPKVPASEQALWRMVQRVCNRAGVGVLSPHQLRHGFANRFLRESGRDVGALRPLLGHSRIDATQPYTDKSELGELKGGAGCRVLRPVRTSVARLDNARPINPQVPSKPSYGGGGNRTRVRSRTE